VLAFYPNKQITTGEGGMVVTDDPRSPACAAAWPTRAGERPACGCPTSASVSTTVGFNNRMDEMSAARDHPHELVRVRDKGWH